MTQRLNELYSLISNWKHAPKSLMLCRKPDKWLILLNPTSQQQSDRIKRIAKMVSWWLILPAHLKQWRQETKLRWPVCCLQLPHSQYRSVPVTGLGPPESRYRAPPSGTDRKSCLEMKVYDLDSQEDLSVTSLLLSWNYTLTESVDIFTPWSQVLVLVIWRCSRPITPPVPMKLPNSSSLPLH